MAATVVTQTKRRLQAPPWIAQKTMPKPLQCRCNGIKIPPQGKINFAPQSKDSQSLKDVLFSPRLKLVVLGAASLNENEQCIVNSEQEKTTFIFRRARQGMAG